MGLWSWLTGVDLGAEQKRSDATNAQLAALNEQALMSGQYDQKTFDEAEANRNRSYEQSGGSNIEADVSGTFSSAVDENAASVRHGVGSFISNALPLKLIPWQLWVIGLVVLFFYLGGPVWIKKLIPKPK